MFDIEELAERIYERTIVGMDYYVHRNMVVVGNNSTGKSTLLKELFKKVIKEGSKEFYYIDSQNRVVTNSSRTEMSLHYSDFDIQSILVARFKEDCFAKEDIFDKGYSGGVVTFSELMEDYKKYNNLLNNFMTCDLKRGSLTRDDSIIGGNDTLYYKDTIELGSISSSEAAKIRLIMEVNYAYERECKVVVIDEFDDHFDTDNMVSFIGKLVEYYSELRFVFVIHNFEAIVRLNGFDVILYNNEKTAPADILQLDSDDITELGQVHKIRSRYIGKRRTQEIFLSECVSEIVKYGKLDEIYKERILQVERERLNSKERILYDFIMENTRDES